jgi:hypothetical protein
LRLLALGGRPFAAALTSTCKVLLLARCALAAVLAADILPDGESLKDEFLTVEF